MGYDLRVGFYRRGMKAIFQEIADPKYRFLMVENKPPYAIFVTALTPASLMIADAKAQRAIEVWGQCLASNQWPGYPSQTCFVDPPPWEEARWEAQKQSSPKDMLSTMAHWQAPSDD